MTGTKENNTGRPERVGGQWKDQIWIAEDFDAPDPEIEELFYSGPLFPRNDPA